MIVNNEYLVECEDGTKHFFYNSENLIKEKVINELFKKPEDIFGKKNKNIRVVLNFQNE